MKRTYGRKNSRRARQDVQDVEHPLSPPLKRPRIEVEIIPPTSSPTSSQAHLSSPTVSSPIRRSTTLPDVGSIPSTPSIIRTPTKSARDLSTLFPTSPRPAPTSPGMTVGVAKRMLSRSRTESSIDRNSSHNLSSLTPSSNTLPVIHSSAKITPSRSPTPSPTPNKPLSTKHTRTYAGASRSYLIALPAADLVEQDDTRESYADLRSRWGVDNSEDDPRPFDDDTQGLRRTPSVGSRLLSKGMMNDLKSITELRSKGESRRFLDEVGYLFEGIESGCAIALRRTSVLEIVTKLCEPDFNRRAKTSDFYARTWDVFVKARKEGPDKILEATLAFFAFLSTRDSQTLSELAHKSDFVSTLLDILRSLTPTSDMKGDALNPGLKKDVLALALSGLDAAGLRATGIIRTDVLPLKALADVIAKSGVIKDVYRLSTPTLLSITLSSLPPSLLPPALQTIPSILNSLRAELLLVPPRVSAWERGLELFPSVSDSELDGNRPKNGKGKERQNFSVDIANPSLAHIHACLRLLDAYLLEERMHHFPSRSDVANDGTDGSREEEFDIHRALADPTLSDDLVELCVAAEILVRQCVRDLDGVAINTRRDDGVEQDVEGLARKTLFSTLRILTLLPSSASSHSRRSYSCTTYSDTLHPFWTPSTTALSLITRVVLCAQAGWIGSLSNVGASAEMPSEWKCKSISVPTYSLPRVESFDLLCLALGLLLNWASGVGDGVSEGMGRVLLNPACSAARKCTHTCSCPPSSQVPLLSCLVFVYQAYRGSIVDVPKPLSARQNQSSPSASCSPRHTPPSRHQVSSLDPPSTPQTQSPELTFLAGYTAVLLGILYTSTSSRKMRVQSTYQSLIITDVSVETLVRDVRDFLALYDDIEGELNDEDEISNNADEDLILGVGSDTDGWHGRGRALEKRSEDIARGVLGALEALQDKELRDTSR